jgi:hypothetical protein
MGKKVEGGGEKEEVKRRRGIAVAAFPFYLFAVGSKLMDYEYSS